MLSLLKTKYTKLKFPKYLIGQNTDTLIDNAAFMYWEYNIWFMSMILCLTDLVSINYELREFTKTRVRRFIQVIKQHFHKKTCHLDYEYHSNLNHHYSQDFTNRGSKQVKCNQATNWILAT